METLKGLLNQYCLENSIMGVLRITRQDKTVFSFRYGFANMETQTVFSEDSLFSLYSITKPFCAIGLLKLIEKSIAISIEYSDGSL